METGKNFHENGGGRFNKSGNCGLAMRIVSFFGGLALFFCSTFNVNSELQRLTTNKRCHREENKLTDNKKKKWLVLSARNKTK